MGFLDHRHLPAGCRSDSGTGKSCGASPEDNDIVLVRHVFFSNLLQTPDTCCHAPKRIVRAIVCLSLRVAGSSIPTCHALSLFPELFTRFMEDIPHKRRPGNIAMKNRLLAGDLEVIAENAGKCSFRHLPAQLYRVGAEIFQRMSIVGSRNERGENRELILS